MARPYAHLLALVSSLLVVASDSRNIFQDTSAPSKSSESMKAPARDARNEHRNPDMPRPSERIRRLRDQFRTLKVSALIFYGRRDNVKILNSYLERNLHSSGGILHEVVFLRNTKNAADLRFLDELLDCHPGVYRSQTIEPPHVFARVLHTLPRNRLYVKIDDDIVYIEDGTIELLVEALLKRQDLYVVSANVINHSILGNVHCHLQAMLPFAPVVDWCEPPLSQQQCIEQGRKQGPCSGTECDWEIVSDPNGTFRPLDVESASIVGTYHYNGSFHPTMVELKSSCFWGDWRCAAIAHNSFLHRLKEDSLEAFKFSVWDFSYPDYVHRWSTNFILFNTSVLPSLDEEYISTEEVMLGMVQPAKNHRHCVAIGETLVAHFGYFPQNGKLQFYTNLLHKYMVVAQQLMAKHHQSPYNTSPACSNVYMFE
eukprot:jgi/Botrbrau1/12345/Bobra.4_3s0017.1